MEKKKEVKNEKLEKVNGGITVSIIGEQYCSYCKAYKTFNNYLCETCGNDIRKMR